MATDKKYDAIVVLGGGVSQTGELNEEIKKRLDLAVALFRSGTSQSIIMTGGYSYKATIPPAITEAKAMQTYAIKCGIAAKHIYVEEDSRETVGNAYFTKVKLFIPMTT